MESMKDAAAAPTQESITIPVRRKIVLAQIDEDSWMLDGRGAGPARIVLAQLGKAMGIVRKPRKEKTATPPPKGPIKR